MIPFVIMADLRSGSTLLSSSLNRHPQIRCYGELFHPDTLPDNQIPGQDRHALSAGEIMQQVFRLNEEKAIGFKAMIFLPMPSQSHWKDAWNVLKSRQDLHVIHLLRLDQLAAYTSALIAQKTGVFHPHHGDPLYRPENRPSVHIDPERYIQWRTDRERLFYMRSRFMRGKPSFTMTYEKLTESWETTIRDVQRFLTVDPIALKPEKQKQETRPLSEAILNYEQLTGHLEKG